MSSRLRKKSAITPIRVALTPTSFLHPLVKNGLQAMEDRHHDCIDVSVRAEFADSIDIDKAMQVGNEQENRWDYLLGHTPSTKVVALEPHRARQDEISTIIRKREKAREQLLPHLKTKTRIASWL